MRAGAVSIQGPASRRAAALDGDGVARTLEKGLHVGRQAEERVVQNTPQLQAAQGAQKRTTEGVGCVSERSKI